MFAFRMLKHTWQYRVLQEAFTSSSVIFWIYWHKCTGVCTWECTHFCSITSTCVHLHQQVPSHKFPLDFPCQMLVTKQSGKGTSLPCRNDHSPLWHLWTSSRNSWAGFLCSSGSCSAVQPWERGDSGPRGRENSMETLGAATCVVWHLQNLQVIHLRALLTAWKWGMLVCGISKGHEIMAMYP